MYVFNVLYLWIEAKTTESNELVHDGGLYHIEISPLVCSANHWTGFYMIRTSVMKELKENIREAWQSSTLA